MNLRLLITLVLAVILLGCSSHSTNHSTEGFLIKENTTYVIVKDDFGYVVAVKKYPKRIVSLAPSNTEILFALGLRDRVVGVTDYCDYPPEILKLKKEGKIVSVGGYSTVDVEKVVRLKPDLVVASYGNGFGVIKALKDFGITVVALNPKNVTDVMRDAELLGKVCGVEENATKLVEWMKDEIAKVKAKKHPWKPKILHIVWNDPIWVSGRGTFVDDVIKIAGGVNVVNESGWVVVSLEDLIRMNPDIIIVNSGNGMDSKGENILYDWVMNNNYLKKLKAVRCGNVYVIDANIICRPSYRIVYAIENLSKIVDVAYEKVRLCYAS
ncbi:ABC transporter substrate-binding protein [Archaeoglobus profundus]|uniref:Periplasmic binding protein n=1 Tax=Archaeoglobus profundus (strain DSM 5631 / JCM 9629 / NBRC 100127 / Av18) TaxID=572546 RepID=D2RGE3_ARCPA|nr:ABC transporter substrate-binding protein [Archaeoglobus profundus]ADB57368.1 periplasmic binding protein [Archaeoglobus profundus DSM 5631]